MSVYVTIVSKYIKYTYVCVRDISFQQDCMDLGKLPHRYRTETALVLPTLKLD